MYSYDNASESWPIPPPTADSRDARRYRSSTVPVRRTSYSPTRPHPPILTPGYVPSTIHKPDLFFGNTSPTTGQEPIHERSPYGHQASPDPPQWPYDSYFGPQAPPPPPPPPVPPLPPSSPELPFPSYTDAHPEPSTAESPISPTDPAQLEQALALSRTESSRQAEFLEKLSSQEEEDLARALQESLGMDSSSMQSYNAQPGSSKDHVLASENTSIVRSESWRSNQSQYSDDEAFARRLAAEEEERNASQSHIDDDEAFARHLAAQEEEEEAQFRSQAQSPIAGPSGISHTINSMDEELARKIAAEEELEKQRGVDGGPLPMINAPSAPPAYNDAVSPPLSGNSRSPSLSAADSSLIVNSSLYRSNSAGSANSYYSSSEVPLPPSAQNSRPASADATSLGSNGQLPTIGSLSSVSEGTEEPQPTVGGNQFVDQELLRGVSIGFVPPAITPTLQIMQAVMPNIISLPYGRCPPLHFMAPNWRHLLKLMARLSGTRVEPTLEALSVIKTDLHLRVVVQFIRPHPASMDWRTVVWFTIDHPVPPSFPGARKYTTSDVELLPWSYTLSSLPNVLRDSVDTPLSKTYTIPATEALPYPKLPISFPNLALYLQAALDESRRYANDSSTGFRKLSRMMDLCYPSLDRMEVGEQSERSKMGGLFKKVIGRGNKSNKSGRRGNEDTYELVTPFVPDEWG